MMKIKALLVYLRQAIVAVGVVTLVAALLLITRGQPLWIKIGSTRLIMVAIGAVLIVLWKIPKIQVAHLKCQGLSADRLVELEDKARATLAQVIGGALLLVTAYFTWQGIANTREAQEEQFRVAVSGQITDRFTSAIEQLNARGEEDPKSSIIRGKHRLVRGQGVLFAG